MPDVSQDPYPISSRAVTIEGVAHNGKKCRIIDNTGTITSHELERLLNDLIEQKQFGIWAQTSGSGRLVAGGGRGGHIQVNDTLYRLVLFSYDAIIENF
jgi:hypothetical protein